VLFLLFLFFCTVIDSRANPEAIAEAAAGICSGNQNVDLYSSTGNVKYKDLKVEITDGGKTLKLKNHGALLAQIRDFTYQKYTECVPKMIAALREITEPRSLDLSWFNVGVTREYVQSKIGQPKFINQREVLEGNTTLPYKWKTVSVFNYEYMGVVVRVTYDEANGANSIFIGLQTEPSTVKLRNPDSWGQNNSRRSREEVAWSQLKFSDFGSETCEPDVHTGAGASVTGVICEYTYYRPGGSRYDHSQCFISLGVSDGAYDVNPVENEPEITENQLAELAEKEHWTDQQSQQWVWDQVKDKSFSYMMISCEKELLLSGW
jgi:hypothetical protein